MAASAVEFGRASIELFRERLLSDDTYKRFVSEEAQALPTYYMGLVDDDGAIDFYDGKVRVVSPDGKEFALVEAADLLSLIAERTEPWTYVKIPYLKDVGWKGFVAGPDSGIYRVGPLARLNVCDRVGTPYADRARDAFLEYFGGGPVHATFAYHWARLIEMLSAAERVAAIIDDPP